MHVYMNGQLRPEVEVEGNWPTPNNADFSRTLELGRFTVGSNSWGLGKVLLDEILIWEEALPCDDVLRLYNEYV